MKAALKKPKYRNMKLVKVAYGNDNPTDSAKETQALLQAYPNLKGIISPTTVGICGGGAGARRRRASARPSRSPASACPNQMRKYVKKGCAKKFGLWNERDFGYLAAYVAHLVLDGKLTGKIGQTFTAGRLGKRTVVRQRRERARRRPGRPARLHARPTSTSSTSKEDRAGRAHGAPDLTPAGGDDERRSGRTATLVRAGRLSPR